MTDSVIIELENVRKRYGNRLALDGVSLQIGPGVTGLLGPNGSGKSTLIKSLMGLVSTDSGKGRVLDYQWPEHARDLRDRVGYLPEDDCYIAGLQGVECVQLSGRLSGLPKLEALRRSHEVMDFCDIGQERYRQVETYSTGMRQKLKFAQTIVHDPPLIILDEPTTGLDPGQRDALLNRIQVLAQEHGKTIVLSTHILPDVRQVCDSVVILVGGRVRISERLEVLSRPSQPSLNISLSSGQEKFLTALSNSQINYRVLPRNELQLVGVDPTQTGPIWRLAQEAGAAISRMEPARASLEQIFMDAVRSLGPASHTAAVEASEFGLEGTHADY